MNLQDNSQVSLVTLVSYIYSYYLGMTHTYMHEIVNLLHACEGSIIQ